jgi:hypothetical protein
MTLRIVPYTAEHEEAVAAFNARLAEHDLDLNLYSTSFPPSHIPTWLPKRPGCDLYQEFFVAVDDDGAVRGGYTLKHQSFLVKGNLVRLAHYQLPISEGIVDRRFVDLAVRLYADALRRQPYLFGLGGGGYHTPVVRFLLAARWKAVLIPFWFRIVNPNVFLQNITAIRSSPARQRLLDLLRASGLGWAGIKAVQGLKGKYRRPARVTSESVPDFGDWTDDVWNDSKDYYALTAVRDRQNLNVLYPASDPRFIRLKVARDGRVIGWAVLLNTKMSDHKHFGDMRVATLVGSLSKPDDARDVVACARDVLEADDADLIVSSQGSRDWGLALRHCGFLHGPSNLPFLAAPKLAALLEPFAENAKAFHLNRGDGDGPIHL